MDTLQEKREHLMVGLRERRQRIRDTVTALQWGARIYSLPVILLVSPELAVALGVRWFGPAVAKATAEWFMRYPEALRSFDSLLLTVGRQEELRALAASDLFLPVLAGARMAARERDLAAAVSMLSLTEEQAEAAVKEAEKLLNDPVVSAGILKIEGQMAGEVDFNLPGDENLPEASRERRKHLLLTLVWFFMSLLILQGTALALPESADRIGEAEQHFEVALELSGIALYLHDRKWRDRQ